MLQTTLMKHRHQMKTTPIENCHDGLGRINCTRVLDRNDPGTTYLKLIHDDILPPGISIGIHTHRNECEYYYILSGSGVMTLAICRRAATGRSVMPSGRFSSRRFCRRPCIAAAYKTPGGAICTQFLQVASAVASAFSDK